MAYNELPIMALRIPMFIAWLHVQQFTHTGQTVIAEGTNNITWKLSTVESSDFATTPVSLPFFENASGHDNLTVELGSIAYFSCKVNNLTDKTRVSWVRRNDGKLFLLSIGTEKYVNDRRYSVQFRQPNDWQLLLRDVNEGDEGHYECQVNSHPRIVYKVFMHVAVPDMEIADERGLPIKNKFYDRGSTIELKCIITNVPQPESFILWKHNRRILNTDTTRGGISVKTDIILNGAKSHLFIANVQPLDSGNYSCALGRMAETYVAVHVLNGETPAAMQHGGSSQPMGLIHLPALLFLWALTAIR